MKQIFISTIFICAFCFAAFAQTDENSCPKIALLFPPHGITPGGSEAIYVTVGNRLVPDTYEYIWSVSAGSAYIDHRSPRIILGAGKELQGASIEVAVKMEGLPKDCSSVASDVISVIQIPEGSPLNKFGRVGEEYLELYLDTFFLELENAPQSEGLIVIRPAQNRRGKPELKTVKAILNHIVFRNIGKMRVRITFAIYGPKKSGEEQTELWLVPPGANLPELGKDALRIKAEDMNKELPKLFKKKTVK